MSARKSFPGVVYHNQEGNVELAKEISSVRSPDLELGMKRKMEALLTNPVSRPYRYGGKSTVKKKSKD